MGLLTRSIESLYNGVSQQPATIRLPNQCEEQINAWGTVVDGLRKRAPTIHIAEVSPTKLEGAHLHSIDRDVNEKYDVVVSNGSIQVFDQTGNSHTVSYPAGKTYLTVPAGSTAEETFSLVTVADFTFIVNKSVTVKMAALDADTQPQNPSYWWLNRSQQGSSTGAQQLQYPPNSAISGYAGVVQSFNDLPDTASVGALYEIQGTADDNFSTYYVIRGAGVWNECRKPRTSSTTPRCRTRSCDSVTARSCSRRSHGHHGASVTTTPTRTHRSSAARSATCSSTRTACA